MIVKTLKKTGAKQALLTHSEHIRFQLDNISLEEDSFSLGQGKNEYLVQICDLIGQVFGEEKEGAHDDLVAALSNSQGFVQEFATSYRSSEQLSELFYDLSLLLARKRPKNKLKKSTSAIVFTSCQYQHDLKSLIVHINENSGVYQNPENQQLFSKRDKQLIKLAAEEHKLALASEQATDASRQQMSDLGLNDDYPVKIIPRANSEQFRLFDPARIYQAVLKAFLDVYKDSDDKQACVRNAESVTVEVVSKIKQASPKEKIDIEQIQSQIEYSLMELSFHDVARAYVIFRDEKSRVRKNRLKQLHQQIQSRPADEPTVAIKMPDGSELALCKSDIANLLQKVFADHPHLNQNKVLEEAYRTIFNGIDYVGLQDALIMSCRCLIESHPDYSFVASRLLRKKLLDEALGYLDEHACTLEDDVEDYSEYLSAYISQGVEDGILNPELEKFDLKKLASALDCSRDFQFTYLGLQTLYDRYFIHENLVRYELPQIFFMRVAMGLALSDSDREAQAISYYNVLSTFDAMSSTPTLFNAGTIHSQLSSCYLSTIPDSLRGIYSGIQDNALLSKFAGGLGNDWTPVRAMGAKIKGTNGLSSGVIPFLNVADATAIAVNQGGKRKGAVCGYLETWHLDIMDFLELRKNTGDDRRRTHDMNTANWVPDLFMERVMNKEKWTLFSPDQVPDLHDAFGDDFRKKYEEYEKLAKEGKLLSKEMDAIVLWRKMLSMLFETGHPWITFKDPCNIRSPQSHLATLDNPAGKLTIKSSNLCTEITLATNEEEIAVCNLASINLPKHMKNGQLDLDKLQKTTQTVMRMLDNVIDLNFYPVEQAKRSNMKHRPVGLGVMGFQDALIAQDIAYESQAAIDFADLSMEAISYYAISASCSLAKERGAYETYAGSLWDQKIFPNDSIELLKKQRGVGFIDQDTSASLDWQALKNKVGQYGMRNSNVLAIAPTATIANICGVTQSIEPTYKNLYVKSNLSGEFTLVNPDLVKKLEAMNLWDEPMVQALKLSNGSVQAIERIPKDIRDLFKTAFEIDPSYLIDCASRRAKWIDQSQSLNLYMAQASGKKLDKLYKYAWHKGLKTTYYLRSLGATDSEKSSINEHALNAVSSGSSPKVCSIEDPDCESCQ